MLTTIRVPTSSRRDEGTAAVRAARRCRILAAMLLAIASRTADAQTEASSPPAPEPTEAAEADRVAIVPGVLWNRGAETPPGTVLELAGPGVHLPAVLEGLRGTEAAPIVVRRNAGGGAVPFVVGGETGLVVRDCEHVLIEEIAFIGATRRAIRIEDSREIAIRNVLVARVGPDSEGDGIEIVESTGIELSTIRFDGWQDAGLELIEAADVQGRDLQFTPLVRHRCGIAIRVGGGCRDVGISEFVTRTIPTGVEIGERRVEDSDSPPAPNRTAEPSSSGEVSPPENARPTPPRGIVVEDGLFDRPTVAFRLADARDVELRRSTIVDPKFVFEIDASGLDAVRFADNLIVWNPGAMEAFARALRGSGELELGANLWWSAELPAARPLLGDLPGREAAPQRFSPDPRLAPRGHPTAPEAAGFGRPAPDGP